RPDQPVYCLRTHTMAALAERFITGFPGKVMYAVKCNDDRRVLRALYEGGIRHFDTASLGEVVAVGGEFERDEGVTCHFMHPVKNRRAIREAYQRMGIRSFALDSAVELEKILQETD